MENVPVGEVDLKASVLHDGDDELLVVAPGAALDGIPDALDHLEVLDLELVAVEHRGQHDVLAVALQDGAGIPICRKIRFVIVGTVVSS